MRRFAASCLGVIAACAASAQGEPRIAGSVVAKPATVPSPAPNSVASGAQVGPSAPRLPGFAVRLAGLALPSGPAAWRVQSRATAWSSLAHANIQQRQAARWDFAVSLIASGSGAEALGVLEVMQQDDPDLGLVPAWQLAHGVALSMLRRTADALQALAGDRLASNSEACLWRMRTMADAGLAQQALTQVACAVPALQARTPRERAPFIIAAGVAAIEAGQPALGLRWLERVPDGDPTANLHRAKAYIAVKNWGEAKLRLERVIETGDPQEKADASLTAIEAGIAAGTIAGPVALKQLDQLRFQWRGDSIEEHALQLIAQLGVQGPDPRPALAAGAVLFRYFSLGAAMAPMLTALQGQLAAALAPGSALPVDQAAGLFWDYRDLAPSGAEGDKLVSDLANRLQGAGLYGRAAQLLQYQLSARTTDVAQGPLSIRVATLYILSGNPKLALDALRDTDAYPYPAEMQWDRHRVEAAALQLLGKTAEALAVLQDVPDAQRIRAEIYWKQQDWAGLVTAGESELPPIGALSDIQQTILLRRAIALAMLGREESLSQLRARYSKAFARLPTAATFDMLTDTATAIDPEIIGRAMISLPSASPAGPIGDLLEADISHAQLHQS